MKRTCLIIAILAVAVSAYSQGVEYTSGKLYKKQGEWLRAWEYFNAAIKKAPDFLPAYMDRGELYMEIAMDSTKLELARQIEPNAADPQSALYDKMLDDFKQATTPRTPKDESTIKKNQKRIEKILDERWTHFYFEAVTLDSAYNRAKTGGITDPDPKTYMRGAIRELDLAIKMMPEKWNSYGLKAQILGRLEEPAQSIENWELAQKAITASDMPKKQPEDYQTALAVIHGNLLQGYYNLNRFKDTEALADEILKAEPENEDALQFMAFALARLATDTTFSEEQRNEYKSKAVRALEKAKMARPDDSVILYYIGQFNLQLGDTTGAIKAFDEFLAKEPKDKEVLFAIGVIYLEGGTFISTEKARDTFAMLTEAYPDFAAAWTNYGIALIRLGDNAKGKEAIEKAKSLGD